MDVDLHHVQTRKEEVTGSHVRRKPVHCAHEKAGRNSWPLEEAHGAQGIARPYVCVHRDVQPWRSDPREGIIETPEEAPAIGPAGDESNTPVHEVMVTLPVQPLPTAQGAVVSIQITIRHTCHDSVPRQDRPLLEETMEKGPACVHARLQARCGDLGHRGSGPLPGARQGATPPRIALFSGSPAYGQGDAVEVTVQDEQRVGIGSHEFGEGPEDSPCKAMIDPHHERPVRQYLGGYEGLEPAGHTPAPLRIEESRKPTGLEELEVAGRRPWGEPARDIEPADGDEAPGGTEGMKMIEDELVRVQGVIRLEESACARRNVRPLQSDLYREVRRIERRPEDLP